MCHRKWVNRAVVSWVVSKAVQFIVRQETFGNLHRYLEEPMFPRRSV